MLKSFMIYSNCFYSYSNSVAFQWWNLSPPVPSVLLNGVKTPTNSLFSATGLFWKPSVLSGVHLTRSITSLSEFLISLYEKRCQNVTATRAIQYAIVDMSWKTLEVFPTKMYRLQQYTKRHFWNTRFIKTGFKYIHFDIDYLIEYAAYYVH